MLRFLDLFAGIGGIRIAFEENGCRCVASSEIDEHACKTYFENFNEQPLGDVCLLTKDNLPEFDILTGGFPCQPFSIGGLRKGFEDTRGTLFFEVARLLKECQPKAFFLENVQGLVNHENGETLKTIENVLSDLGYNFEWKVMNAKDYGIPQNRSRWYCVGFRKDIEYTLNYPSREHLKVEVKDLLDKDVKEDYRVSNKVLENISKYMPIYLEKHNSDKLLIAHEVRASRCAFRNDGISPCLTAKMGTGGNNVPIIVSEERKMTEKECLRLMGFPDWFKITENTSHSYKQIGNSVVIPIVSVFAKEIVRNLS